MNNKWKMFKITLGELFLCEVVQYAGTIRYKKNQKKQGLYHEEEYSSIVIQFFAVILSESLIRAKQNISGIVCVQRYSHPLRRIRSFYP